MSINRLTVLNISLLGLLGFTFYVLIQVLINPRFGYPKINNLQTEILLPSWKLQQQKPLQTGETKHFIAASHYIFRQNQTEITAEIRYFISPEISVDNRKLIQEHGLPNTFSKDSPLAFKTHPQNQKPDGYYGTFIYGGRIYLSSCIAHDGYVSVDEQDYYQKRFRRDLTPARIFPWLLQSQPLLDTRCVWSLLSTSVSQAGGESAALVILRAFWVPWSQWWVQNYPRWN